MRVENNRALINTKRGRQFLFTDEFVELRERPGEDETPAHLPLAEAWAALAKIHVTTFDRTQVWRETPYVEVGLVRITLDEGELGSPHPVAGARTFLFHHEFVEVDLYGEGKVNTWCYDLDDAWDALRECV
jgi:hypothetical protein